MKVFLVFRSLIFYETNKTLPALAHLQVVCLPLLQKFLIKEGLNVCIKLTIAREFPCLHFLTVRNIYSKTRMLHTSSVLLFIHRTEKNAITLFRSHPANPKKMGTFQFIYFLTCVLYEISYNSGYVDHLQILR